MGVNPSVIPPDDTTLFTSSGMQKHKRLFGDPAVRGLVLGDSQTCFRTVDLDEVGDGSHGLSFRMLGLFSFRSWTLLEGMSFWLGFVRSIGCEPDRITAHPDKLAEHRELWGRLGVGELVEPDEGCKWSDGSIGGYCTEMYKGGLEIGNIVNPLGDCLDCGFGLERLGMALGVHAQPGSEPTLRAACELLLGQGVFPGANSRGHVLRKIMRRMWREGSDWTEPLYLRESERLGRARGRYERLVRRHPDKPSEWWWDTHGVDLAELGVDGPGPLSP